MTAPHADEVLALADGRVLAWAEWGDPRGTPVVFLHPCPGSRMVCPDPEATAAAGVRLITVDRPGYGRSDPVAEPTLAGFARDLERLLDHLWLGQIPVVGWSCGGQYAAACAALLAERVCAVALVAVPAPDDQVPWLTPRFRAVAELANSDPKRALAAAAVLGEGEGVAADVVAGGRSWGFTASQVGSRAALFYREDDSVIGPMHGRWWARALPGAVLTIHRGSGPADLSTAWADILRAIVESPQA